MAKLKKPSKKNTSVKVANKNKSKKTFAKRNASKSSVIGKRPQIVKSKNKKTPTKRVPKIPDPIPKKDQKSQPQKKKAKKRKFKDVESSDEEEENPQAEKWENKPRSRFADDLNESPIENGAETGEGQEAEEEQKEEEADEEEEDIPVAELLLKKKQNYEDTKDKVGSLATTILSDPTRNVTKFKPIVVLLDQKDDNELFPTIFIRTQTLVSFALLELFKDVLPTYRIMEKTVEEMQSKTKLKRETRELREFETTMLKYYKIYIDRMERMVCCLKKKQKSNFFNSIKSISAREKLALVGARCLSELMVTHPYFNLRDQVIASVIPLLSSRNEKIRTMVFEAVSKLYREDKSGQVSLIAVKETGKLIKALKLNVEPIAISSFLCLRIKEVKQKQSEVDMRKLREKLNGLSRKERRYNKKMKKLTSQLRETEAQEDQKKKLEFHTQILNQIFFVYFRLLKDIIEFEENDANLTSKLNDCLTPILQGLSKFCHLINVDFYDDLVGLLYRLISCGKLNISQILLTTNTVFTILSGEGSSINVDPYRFYVRVYSCLPSINSNNFGNESEAQLLSDCIEKMFFLRKKQLSMPRIYAFCKRLSSVALQSSTPMTALIVSAIRTIMKDHPKCDVLLDTENFASGKYSPELDDPDFCNAGSSRLWELHTLKQHPNAIVRLLVLCIIKKTQMHSIDLLKKTPFEVYLEVKKTDEKKLNDGSPAT